MDVEERYQLFQNPTREYKGKPFWSWNGQLKKDELLRQIDIMKKMGFGGYFMHSRTGLETEYLGEEWFKLIDACADYGEEHDMESWLYDEDRWPSGTAGGIVTEDKKYRAMFLAADRYGFDQIDGLKWDRHVVAAFACHFDGIHYSDARRLNNTFEINEEETLVIFSTHYADCEDVYNGYTYLDTMNREGVEKFIRESHEKYSENCGSRIGKSIPGIFTDEPHRGALFSSFSGGRENMVPYTPHLFEEFEKRFGYDLKSNLMDLFFRNERCELSKISRDFVELCQKLFIENFAVPIQTWCHDHHMIFTGHVLHEDSLIAQTVMQGSLMRFYEYMDYPGMDLLTEHNECWWVAKQVTSAARQLNKPKVLSELYGATGWQMSLESYKNVGDWQALFGVNLRCPHLSWYTMKGEAKRDYPSSILHQSPWYEEYKYMEDYFSRINVFFEEGEPECDLLVLNPIESVWARAYSGAFDVLASRDGKINALEMCYEEVFRRLVRRRIDFDYGEEDILARHAKIIDGCIEIGKAKYHKVLVAGMDTMRSSTLKLLKQFVSQGGKVIFAGDIPRYIDVMFSNEVLDLSRDCKVYKVSDAFEESCLSGNEIGITGEGSDDIFAQTRLLKGMRVVFLLNIRRNRSYRGLRICLGQGTRLELWDARSGKREKLGCLREAGKLYINLNFEKGEEKLIAIFDDNEKSTQDSPDKKSSPRDVPAELIQMSGSEKRITPILNVPESYSYTLSEKNICVLDQVKVMTDAGDFLNRQEVLKADRNLRDLFHVPYRSGEMLQPWFEKKRKGKEKKICGLVLQFDFKVDYCPDELELAIEDIEHIRSLSLNGRKIKLVSLGKWVDICFDRIVLPADSLKEDNVIEIEYDYYKTCGLEAIYLLGNFGVKLSEDRKTPYLTKLPKRLKIGDITTQGLPFYSGKITYQIEGFANKTILVRLDGISGSCVKLFGKKNKMIAFSPYESEIRDLKGIQIILTRRNTFGPLHQLPAVVESYAPNNFMTTGEDWSDGYVLLPYGLMKGPEYFEIIDGV